MPVVAAGAGREVLCEGTGGLAVFPFDVLVRPSRYCRGPCSQHGRFEPPRRAQVDARTQLGRRGCLPFTGTREGFLNLILRLPPRYKGCSFLVRGVRQEVLRMPILPCALFCRNRRSQRYLKTANRFWLFFMRSKASPQPKEHIAIMQRLFFIHKISDTSGKLAL